jgi:hypothetical protein
MSTFIGSSVFPNLKVDKSMIQPASIAANFIFDVAERALKDFQESRFENFDALVGDTACQIRVVMLLDLTRNFDNLEISDIITRIQEVQKRLLNLNFRNLIPRRQLEFEDFCKKNDLFLEIPYKYLFLIEAYILKQSSDSNAEKTKPENLQELTTVTVNKNFLEKIVRNTQKSLSRHSVEYLQTIAGRIKYSLPKNLVYVDKSGIQGLPCFIGIEILIRQLSEGKYYSILRCKNKLNSVRSFLFKGNKRLVAFEKNAFEKKLLKPVFVVEGYGEALDEKKVKQFGFEDILKANAAQHDQYFSEGKGRDPFESSDERYEEVRKYRKLALEEGFCYKNPLTFCVEHIFCQPLIDAVRS